MRNLVYSSRFGKMCPECGKPIAECICKKTKKIPSGPIRVRREVKKRGGKTVTVVTGLPLDSDALKDLASEFKRQFGVGGSIKDGNIEIQGDHCKAILEELKKRGYSAKRSGG